MSGDPWCDGAGACLVLTLGALLLIGGGWVDGVTYGVALLLGALIGILLGLLAIKLWSDGGAEADGALARTGGYGSRSPRSPEDLLRERYVRNELSRERYLATLEDILKDRYVRGELDLHEYEARLDQLLREPGGPADRGRAERRGSVAAPDRP